MVGFPWKYLLLVAVKEFGAFIEIAAGALLDFGLQGMFSIMVRVSEKGQTLSLASCFSSFLTSTREALRILSRSFRDDDRFTHFPLLMDSRSTP